LIDLYGDAVLPEEVLRLPAKLDRVDDPVFFGPFTPFFDPRLGRPSTPTSARSTVLHPPRQGRTGSGASEAIVRAVANTASTRPVQLEMRSRPHRRDLLAGNTSSMLTSSTTMT
jgi:hypothetical protein